MRNQYESSGVYQLACLDCGKHYVGQTGNLFTPVLKYHVRDYQLGYQKSLYAKHLLDNKHMLHPKENSLTILHQSNKGRLLNTFEKLHIYKETKTRNQLNDRHNVTYSAIFETLLDSPSPSSPLTGLLQHNHPDIVHCRTRYSITIRTQYIAGHTRNTRTQK
jgi:hypothetical protein